MTSDPISVAVALGSNLGNRKQHLQDALRELARSVDNLRVSSFFETNPVGVEPDAPRFLNAAAVGNTSLSATDLLAELLAIERRGGRTRPYAGASRAIDLDLIFYGGEVIDAPGLVVPHPRFRERRFVLEPLAEIAPEWRDPVTGKTVAELLRLAALT